MTTVGVDIQKNGATYVLSHPLKPTTSEKLYTQRVGRSIRSKSIQCGFTETLAQQVKWIIEVSIDFEHMAEEVEA